MLVDLATYARSLEQQLGRARTQSDNGAQSSPYPTSSTFRLSPSSHVPIKNEDKPQDSLSLRVKKIGLDREDQLYQRHVGSSSHLILLQTALEIRNEMHQSKESSGFAGKKRNEVWDEFWIRQPWHHFPPETEDSPYIFPPDDLLRSLITLYFNLQHNINPLLHRQIFEREVFTDKLHTTDRRFGAVVLAVCALGSRLSNDSRNLFNGTNDERSLGWKYFNQIRMARTNFAEPPTLFEVQILALSLLFIFPTPICDAGWATCGLAIRFVLEVGAHRKQYFMNKGKQDRIEAEQWRRAFWFLVTADLAMSIALGRPRSVREDDFDLELPPECDDEYWENPTNLFVQLEGQLSRSSYWHQNMKLLRIAGLVKDNLYATRKAAPWLDSSPDSNAEIVIELDSALNNWLDALPDHLKWNPHHPDDTILAQLVMLHGNYYWVQIQAHKLFIRSDSLSTSSFPSLAICTNAARSFAHIIQAYHSRPNSFMLTIFIAPMFLSATLLLINTWTSLRAKSSYDPRKDMNDVSRILQILSVYERRYEMAGRVREMLQAIMGIDHIPLSASPEKSSLKRPRPSQSTDKADPFRNRSRMGRGEYDGEEWNDFDTPHPVDSQRAISAVRSSFQGDDIRVAAPPAHVQPSILPFSQLNDSGNSDCLNVDPGLHASTNVQVEEMPLQLSTAFSDLGSLDTIPTMGYDFELDPLFAVPVSSAWGQPGHEDWASFMSKVDDLLQFINPMS
ncbi:fungal-specific transcription factor domain-containing protein [Lentinula aciculospora]|uniref:Fungal-specific transcription factor domain-containing protein n=1 Tax=Lentinula aciculospora TaxID=153920 RepID=A0A9W9APK3_9AGAR|nr:fungal-specific transcription factor domain-containing protein [Lentinula aciculospora]